MPGPTGPTGPTGPAGIGFDSAVVFDPAMAITYPRGQVVLYNGGVYVVTSAPPTGVPGSSPDYTPITVSGGVTGATGPTGPTGPTGAVYLGKATICKNAASCQTASLWVLTSINS